MKRFLPVLIIGVLVFSVVVLHSAEEMLSAGSTGAVSDDGISRGGTIERIVFSRVRAFGAPCCPIPDVAEVARRIQDMEGIRSITVTKEGIECLVDPEVVTIETIADAFYLQGVKVQP